MSKEVEVTNIQLTATVPETIELSLGYGQKDGALTAINNNGVGLVQAPANSNDSEDWSNTVAFYDYYGAPMLIPASSINGTNIWTTLDATGVGKTVDASGASIPATPGTLTLLGANDKAVVTPNSGTGATASGYYIDFPVWFRTTQTSNVTLSVKANVYDGSNPNAKDSSGSTEKLYKAARVSILKGETPAADGVIIPYVDGSTAQSGSKYYVTSKALAASGTLGTQGNAPTYGNVDAVTQNTTSNMDAPDGEPIIIVPGKGQTVTGNYTGSCANTSTTYGDAVCVIVRVWLEGEDTDCWNATAGQDFQVNLEFTKKTTT